MDSQYTDDNSKTYGHLGLKDVMIQYSQELNNAYVEWDLCSKGNYHICRKTFIIRFRRMFFMIDSPKTLSKITEKERLYIKKLNNKPNLLTPGHASNIVKIIRKMLDKFGLYDISRSSDEL